MKKVLRLSYLREVHSCQVPATVIITRTLIGNPKIVLMDEPTSAFDSAGEMSFLKNMPNFLDDKTLILVTHKSSLLSLVDKILIIEDGLVKGYGPKENDPKKCLS